jgi:hypothetical protein
MSAAVKTPTRPPVIAFTAPLLAARRCLIPLALLVVGCSHPTAVQQLLPPSQSPHFVRWAGSSPPQFTSPAVPSGPMSNRPLLAASLSGLSLAQYSVAFWAVRGEQRSVQINYLSATGDSSAPFLRLTTTDPAYVPGVGDLAPGDSVLITVSVDPINIKVSLEPTGLLFGEPGQLQVSYGGADGDLNGDGVVDGVDAYIESQLLGLWYREGQDSTWTRIPASRSLLDQSFTSELPHFSEYAVSW